MKNALRFAAMLLLPQFLHAQQTFQLMAAQQLQRIPASPERTAMVQDLAYNGWIQVDTFVDLKKKTVYQEFDLAPFVDELGESAFLVTDVAPEFPGGMASQQDYFQNLLPDLLVSPNESPQNTLFVKFSVQKDGHIEAVEPAQNLQPWIPATVGERCLQAVREMPNWSPGLYKNRPVKTKVLISFGLRE